MKVNCQIYACPTHIPTYIIHAKNRFIRRYIKGDIRLRKYFCGGGVGCLKTGDINKRSLSKGCLINAFTKVTVDS